MVFQDAGLFNRSIAENVRIGRPDDATGADVERACGWRRRTSSSWQSPADISFVIGERGALLSGGERQRLAVAPRHTQDAPILILDEATSALDAETEARSSARSTGCAKTGRHSSSRTAYRRSPTRTGST